ncbi:MAG: hypothetical protein GDA43_26615 [Hormoscilla sp. SP5CHS1]|nr:hypothetical protein [Hormoscilla sp. SP5CHS1]
MDKAIALSSGMRSAINSRGTATVKFAINRQFSDALPLPVSYRVIKAEKGRGRSRAAGAL